MTHDEAFRRLPDLLDDRDDASLLQHVRECADCQRQLFLLGRIDRALGDSAPPQSRRRFAGRAFAGGGALVAAAAVAILLAIFVPWARTRMWLSYARPRGIRSAKRRSRAPIPRTFRSP